MGEWKQDEVEPRVYCSECYNSGIVMDERNYVFRCRCFHADDKPRTWPVISKRTIVWVKNPYWERREHQGESKDIS
jgi:hypothetical protein